MCGIAGFFDPSGSSYERLAITAKQMARTLTHRGPDDEGVWADTDAGIAFAHRRLSIVDTGPSGHQPMHSRSGRYVIVYNGEIYNHVDLKRELDNGKSSCVCWAGRSDTEVLLACVELWGLEHTLEKLIGMFAFALWDRFERRLYLVRDRMGEKPLYYGWQQGVFLFGSELKALKAHSACLCQIDRRALALFLEHACVPAPYSIYEGLRKLLPGTWLCLECGNGSAFPYPEPRPYWAFSQAVCQGYSAPLVIGDREATDRLEDLLGDAIRRQMVSDVPLGAFLSGGIDSSTIVSLMQSCSAIPIRTFTVGFDEVAYDEALHAEAVARHLGTTHETLLVGPNDALGIIPALPELYDEPFADASQIPMAIIARFTGARVKVALSGDGGDELFGGYRRHLSAHRLMPVSVRIPASIRRTASAFLKSLPDPLLDQAGRGIGVPELSLKASKAAAMLGEIDIANAYRNVTSVWEDSASLVGLCERNASGPLRPYAFTDALDAASAMMAWDASGYLPDDILVKVDRAAMGFSLETRAPFLDHRVVEFAWRLPLNMKIRSGQGKWILRQVLYRHLPKHLFARPKAGFSAPVQEWLRGPLRDWAQELLDPVRLLTDGYFDPNVVSLKLQEHLSGRRSWAHQLWAVLMFQAWLQYVKSANR